MVFGLTFPNIVQSCWNFDQRYSSNKTSTVFEKSFKSLNFESIGTHRKFTVLVHFGIQFTPGKPKILLITKFSGKTTSLAISKKSHYACKIKQKQIFFGPNLGINCPLGPRQRIIRNSDIAYDRTIHLYFLHAKFQLLSICCSQLYLEETTKVFLVQDPIGPNFLFSNSFYFIYFYRAWGVGWGVGVGWEVGSNNSSKQCQIELKF